MANDNPNESTRFQRGGAGNKQATGRPVVAEVVKYNKTLDNITTSQKRLNRIIISEKINHYLQFPIEELVELSSDTSLAAIDFIIIRVIATAGQGADINKLTFLLDRMIGKMADKFELSIDDTMDVKLSIEERRERIYANLQKLKTLKNE